MLELTEAFCIEWAKRTLKPAVQGKHDFVLFCDNLEGRKNLECKDAVASFSGIVWYGLANANVWQPVDAGYEQILKANIKQEFEMARRGRDLSALVW